MVPLATQPSIFAQQTNVQKVPERPITISYADAYSQTVHRRCLQALATLYGFCLLISILFQLRFSFNLDYISSVLSMKTIGFSQILFIAILPLFAVRFITSTVQQSNLPNVASEVFVMLTAVDNWIIAALYATSSFFIIRYYMKFLMGDTYTDALFIYPHGHHIGARQLNQENIFVVFYAILLGITFAVRSIYERRSNIEFPSIQQEKIYTIKASISSVCHEATHIATRVFGFSYVAYLFLNGTIYHHVAEFFGMYTRMLDSPVHGFQWYDLYLMARMVLGGIIAVSGWELSDRLFMVFFEVVEPVSLLSPRPFECLLSGLQNHGDTLLQATAYAELARLASRDPARRSELFRNIGTGVNDTEWSRISGECLKTIETYRTNIAKEVHGKKRGKEQQQDMEGQLILQYSPSLGESTGVPPPVNPHPIHQIKLLEKNIYAAPKKEVVYLDDRSSLLFVKAVTLATGSNIPPADMSDRAQEIVTTAPENMLLKVLKYLEKKSGHWRWVKKLGALTVKAQYKSVFNNYSALLYSIESLGSLLAASLNEDPYGYVQRDIEKILNVLLGTLIETEEAERVNELGFLITDLKQAIYTIRSTFGPYLEDIKIQRNYQSHWRRFLEYKH
ncbi:nucleoporin protein Ndc1-Nup [Phycomyces nitens]|nr:nucleoporin protein Ndc1-Nup [Phycomyces nitens]